MPHFSLGPPLYASSGPSTPPPPLRSITQSIAIQGVQADYTSRTKGRAALLACNNPTFSDASLSSAHTCSAKERARGIHGPKPTVPPSYFPFSHAHSEPPANLTLKAQNSSPSVHPVHTAIHRHGSFAPVLLGGSCGASETAHTRTVLSAAPDTSSRVPAASPATEAALSGKHFMMGEGGRGGEMDCWWESAGVKHMWSSRPSRGRMNVWMTGEEMWFACMGFSSPWYGIHATQLTAPEWPTSVDWISALCMPKRNIRRQAVTADGRVRCVNPQMAKERRPSTTQ
eukprot:365123-Chlamydomonas_euryale.AAC.12